MFRGDGTGLLAGAPSHRLALAPSRPPGPGPRRTARSAPATVSGSCRRRARTRGTFSKSESLAELAGAARGSELTPPRAKPLGSAARVEWCALATGHREPLRPRPATMAARPPPAPPARALLLALAGALLAPRAARGKSQSQAAPCRPGVLRGLGTRPGHLARPCGVGAPGGRGCPARSAPGRTAEPPGLRLRHGEDPRPIPTPTPPRHHQVPVPGRRGGVGCLPST